MVESTLAALAAIAGGRSAANRVEPIGAAVLAGPIEGEGTVLDTAEASDTSESSDSAAAGDTSGGTGIEVVPDDQGGPGRDQPQSADDPAGGPAGGPAASVTVEDLVRDHSDAVYRVALSVTRDPALAEDVSQDALIKAWQALPSFRGESPLRNWVLRITHNTAISALRRRRDELREPDDLPERPTWRTVEGAVTDRLAIDRFEEALNDLDDVSRAVVVLREVEGLTYSELCDVLDLPMPTVKTRLLRARRQLAKALEGWQP